MFNLKLNITPRDKKMLIVLTIFLVGVVYYLYLIDPLFKMNASISKRLSQEKKEFLISKTKLAGFVNYKKKYLRFSSLVATCKNNVRMPFTDVSLDDKIKAIMEAAAKSGVNIASIRPMDMVLEENDGKTNVIKDKHFSIDGTGTIDTVLNFLQNLWGTTLDNINLTSLNSDGSSLRFYIEITFLQRSDFEIYKTEISEKNNRQQNFTIKRNPFDIVRPPVKRIVAPPSPPTVDATLLGIVKCGKEKVAVFKGNVADNQVDYLRVGNTYKSARVINITDNQVTFIFPDKQTVIKTLSEDATEAIAINAITSAQRKPGRFGIFVETFTQHIATELHMVYFPGLIVLAPPKDSDTIRKNDIITTINDFPVSNFERAKHIMKNVYSGDTIKIKLLRNGKEIVVNYKAE